MWVARPRHVQPIVAMTTSAGQTSAMHLESIATRFQYEGRWLANAGYVAVSALAGVNLREPGRIVSASAHTVPFIAVMSSGESGDDGDSRFAGCAKAWPDIEPDPTTFHQWLAERDLTPGDVSDEILGDAYLAAACSSQQPGSANAFQREFQKLTRSISLRYRTETVDADELSQRILSHLLVPTADRAPAIAAYTARGRLGAFVRVVATRCALNAIRGQRPLEGQDDDLANLVDEQADPELQHLRQTYSLEFRAAVESAIAALSDEHRLLLQLRVVDELPLKKVAEVLGKPLSTVARHEAQARDKVAEATRSVLRERLNVEEETLLSILRLVRSDVDITMSRLLGQA